MTRKTLHSCPPGGATCTSAPRGSDITSPAGWAAAYLACLAALAGGTAHAFTIGLAPATPKTIYLRIGDGTYTGTYCGPGCTYTAPVVQSPGSGPGINATINVVSVNVPANAVGNGTARMMTTNSVQVTSAFDNFAECTAPNQLYVGGFYRTVGVGAGSISLIATLPVSLTDGAGDTIPFTQISWTSSGNDNANTPFPAGSFTGTTLTVGSIGQNQWAENCWTFSYKNTVVPAAGTYTGRVLYTLTAP